MQTTDDATAPRLVQLQVNTSGAWRNVMVFDVARDHEVMDLAPRLFLQSQYGEHAKLRVIVPGDTAPLVDWSWKQGWLEWGARRAHAKAAQP